MVKALERVTNLKSKEDKLQKQILALKECKDGKVTVEQLKHLDVYVDLTNDNRTSKQGKRIIDAEIAEFEKLLGVCNICFPHTCLLSLSSMTRSQHVCRVELFVVSIHSTFELSHYMWLYCLCGVGNLGLFGGTASGLLALTPTFSFICLA